MPDEHYINPTLAELYDLDSPWTPDRDFYLALTATTPLHILDLGCGTGLLCNAYAARRFVSVDGERMTFDLQYRFPSRSYVSRSVLRFASYKDIKRFLETTGLQILSVLGDWDGSAFKERTSPEMIFTAGLKTVS